MHRGQRGHPYQAPRGPATTEQVSGAQGAHAYQMSLLSSNKSDLFALSQRLPSQRQIDGYFATACGNSPQYKVDSNTLSEYFAESKEAAFPSTKDFTTTYWYNNGSDVLEDLDVQMTEIKDDDDFMIKTEEKLQPPQTVPNISSAMNTLNCVTERMEPHYHQGGIKDAHMPRVSANHGSGGPPQQVSIMNTHRGTTVASNAVRGPSRASGTGAEKNQESTKVVSDRIRLRSIHHATSVQQVLDGSMDQSSTMVDEKYKATVVLVEIIGTLDTPMVYSGFCWNFSVLDPTRQDYLDKHPLSPPPSMMAAPPALKLPPGGGPQSVSCQLFDMGNTLNLEILEQGELIRAIGVVSSASKRERETEREKKDKETKLLCVACRRATADEARLTIEGSTRCPPPKSD
ncbi:hypothetical protein BGZ81_011321 [Podila clonocystis]|nr:hypothetical protein BGZ81_011321 [Podila clonocystis]